LSTAADPGHEHDSGAGASHFHMLTRLPRKPAITSERRHDAKTSPEQYGTRSGTGAIHRPPERLSALLESRGWPPCQGLSVRQVVGGADHSDHGRRYRCRRWRAVSLTEFETLFDRTGTSQPTEMGFV